MLFRSVANAMTVALASQAAAIIFVTELGVDMTLTLPVGRNGSILYIVPMPLPCRKGFPDEFRKVTPPPLNMLKHPVLSRWPIKMRLWDRSGQ